MLADKENSNLDTDVLNIGAVRVAYGEKQVLDEVEFAVNAGETFGLIGLNGVGKTTLIKSVLGLRNVDSGSIAIKGYQPNDVKARVGFAYLPERFDPPPFLTGMEFIKFSLSLYKTPFNEEAAYKAAELLALDPQALKNRMHTYSKGMRQKVGLLATYLTGCELLILDEPMSGLDPKARALVKRMLVEARNEGRTVFLSSHILSDMNEICDRVAVLHATKIQYIGTPEGLRKQGKDENLEKAFLNLIDSK